MTGPSRSWIRWLLVGGVLVLSLLGAELALRIWTPPSIAWRTSRVPGSSFLLDRELGFRPRPGSELYGEHGALRNDYLLEKASGKRRILFLGDSVTRRALLVNGIRRAFGEDSLEYWNAGVEGYGTMQEVGLYEKHLGAVSEDHVVLTLHINDVFVSPTLVRSKEGLVFRCRKDEVLDVDPFWVQRSYLYRLFVRWRGCGSSRPKGEETLPEIRRSLERLVRLTEERGSELTVLLFPLMKPESGWPPAWRTNFALLREMLLELGIRHFDLREPMGQALEQGVTVNAGPRDFQHTTESFGDVVGRYLLAEAFEP